MKEKIDITDYANLITKALPKGILLNTNGEKFNSMVIGWGHLGTLWSRPTFHVYVRQGRYTREQLDKTGEFTISIPLDQPDPVINKICGWQSGHTIDKVKEAEPIRWRTEISIRCMSGRSKRRTLSDRSTEEMQNERDFSQSKYTEIRE